MLLGDFNAREGTASEINEVIGMFGEETSNNNGEKLVSFLIEVDLVSCNGRTFVTEPEWTRIRPGLKQKSIIDYIITDWKFQCLFYRHTTYLTSSSLLALVGIRTFNKTSY